jgi:TonB family protein
LLDEGDTSVANAVPNAFRNPGSAPGGPSSDTQALSRPNVDLTALTQRDDFLLELGETLGGQASVHPVDSMASALESLSSTKRGQVLVIDARGVQELRADVERVAREAPHAIVLVFAESHAERDTAAALKGTRVFAVLTIPLQSQKTAAVLDAALQDAVNRSAAVRGTQQSAAAQRAEAPTIGAFRVTAPASAAAAEPPRGWPGMRLWAALAAAGLVLLAAGGWYMVRGWPAPHPTLAGPAAPHAAATVRSGTPLEQPAVDTSIVQGKVDELLEKARRAMRERHYTSPKGDNALVYYRSAQLADPQSGEARDGLRRVGNVLVSRFNQAMGSGAYPAAALALATLRVARPTDARIGPFEVELADARISKALAAGNLARASALLADARQSGAVPQQQLATWQAEISRLKQSARAQTLAGLIEERIQSDELTGPAGDSAQDYLAQLRSIAPGSAAAQQATQTLTSALLARARADGLAGNSAGEARWVAAARADGVSQSRIAQLQRQLTTSQAQATQARADHLLSLVRARLASGALTGPAEDSAAYYLTQLEQSPPPATLQASVARQKARLAAALLARARREMRSGEKSVAEADLSQAGSWGASASQVSAIEHEASPGAPVAKAASGPDFARLAAELERVRYTPPRYPDEALTDRIAGTVTVQFLVDKRGITRDVKVVSADPPGVFDRAVRDAVRQWRYRPARYHGEPIAVPVKTLIRFELPK